MLGIEGGCRIYFSHRPLRTGQKLAEWVEFNTVVKSLKRTVTGMKKIKGMQKERSMKVNPIIPAAEVGSPGSNWAFWDDGYIFVF